MGGRRERSNKRLLYGEGSREQLAVASANKGFIVEAAPLAADEGSSEFPSQTAKIPH